MDQIYYVVQSLNHVWQFVTSCAAAGQASMSFTISWSLFKLMSVESVMASSHLVLCCPLLLPSIFPSIRIYHVLYFIAQSCRTLCDLMDCSLPGSSVQGDSPVNNTGVSCHALLQGGCSVSSVAQSCPTLCDPMNRSMPGLPVHHQLPEFTQTGVHWVGAAIQPSHPLSSPSPPAPNPSQHQGLFQLVNSSHEVAKVLEFQLQHQSFQWTPRTDLL